MYFIQEGIVDIVSNGEVATSLSDGSYFGEIWGAIQSTFKDGLNQRLSPRLNPQPDNVPKRVLTLCLNLRPNSSLKLQMSIEFHPCSLIHAGVH